MVAENMMAKKSKSIPAKESPAMPTANPTAPPPDSVPPSPQEMHVVYVRSNQHRVIHVEGIYGGPTVLGTIHMGVFSERTTFPTEEVYAVTPAGVMQPNPKKAGFDGPCRELEASLVLTIPVAKLVRDWLNTVIENTEKNMEVFREAQKTSETN
jgi:hypothetical protein